MWRRAGAIPGEGPDDPGHQRAVTRDTPGTQGTGSRELQGQLGVPSRYCSAGATGEALSVLLRSDNAGANTIADHLTVLDQAIARPARRDRCRHRQGDAASLVRRAVRARNPARTPLPAKPPLGTATPPAVLSPDLRRARDRRTQAVAAPATADRAPRLLPGNRSRHRQAGLRPGRHPVITSRPVREARTA